MMADTDQQREDVAPADTAAAQTSAPGGASPDALDRALADFEIGTSKQAGPVPDDFFAEPTPDNVDALLRQDGDAADTVRHANELDALQGRDDLAAELRASQLEQALAQIQQHQWLEKERADFTALIKEAQQSIADLPLPEGFAERWLIAEAMKNDKLASYFDNRHHPDARTRATINNYLRDTLRRLDKEARSVPDQTVTADVEAVISAMKSGQGKRDAPEPPPNLSRMTDSELNRWSQANVGFLAISR